MSTPSTRQRTNPQPGGTDALNNNLPKRRGKALQPVSKPLQNTSLNTVIYWLAAGTLLVSVFYAYRITQWKADAGGWWNLALGKRPPQMQPGMHAQNYGGGSVPTANSGRKDLDLEGHINGIASILGVQPTDLASAISGIVKQNVAPKSLSSLSSSASAASAKKTAVDALFAGDSESEKTGGAGPSLGSVAKAMVDDAMAQ